MARAGASANMLPTLGGSGQQGVAALKQSGTPDLPVSPDEQGPPMPPANVSPAGAMDKIQAKADPSALSSDDWLALAAGLLSNKSQYASEALGSGLGSLVAGRAARGKMAMEQQKMAAEAEELAQRGRYYGAQADIQPQKAQMWSDKAASMAQGITDKLTLGKMSNLIAEGKQLHNAIPGTPEGIAAQARLSQISNELASLRGSAPVAQNTPMTGFTVTPRG
jgi:hypothetical protein